MTDRQTILRYMEDKAEKLRAKANEGHPGWAIAKHDAIVIDALASDVRAELDRSGE